MASGLSHGKASARGPSPSSWGNRLEREIDRLERERDHLESERDRLEKERDRLEKDIPEGSS